MKFDARRLLAGRGLLVTVVAAGVLAGGGATAAFAAADDDGRGASPSDDRPVKPAVSLTQAVDAALKAVPGKVEEIDLDDAHGRTVWEADVLADDGTWRDVTVDADNAKVTGNRADRPDEDDDGDHWAEAAALRNAKVTVSDAAGAALKAVPGRVTSAEFEHDDGKAVWELDVTAQDGTEHEVTVNAVTGKVIDSETGDED
ncbi:PepSY domain-containing protein [Spirillospora sp. CA-128828]|uniref:PepSY domain-containing protein n=1 Tax=Spirillospora sp. CA-128828 TaxID=3240033 RepID=UPI003D8AEDF8